MSDRGASYLLARGRQKKAHRSVSRRRKQAPRSLGETRGRGGKVTTRWVEPTPHVKNPDEPATEKQRDYVEGLARRLGIEPPEIETKADASMVIGWLKQMTKRAAAPRRKKGPRYPARKGAWRGNADWMGRSDFAVVEDAMSRQVRSG